MSETVLTIIARQNPAQKLAQFVSGSRVVAQPEQAYVLNTDQAIQTMRMGDDLRIQTQDGSKFLLEDYFVAHDEAALYGLDANGLQPFGDAYGATPLLADKVITPQYLQAQTVSVSAIESEAATTSALPWLIGGVALLGGAVAAASSSGSSDSNHQALPNHSSQPEMPVTPTTPTTAACKSMISLGSTHNGQLLAGINKVLTLVCMPIPRFVW